MLFSSVLSLLPDGRVVYPLPDAVLNAFYQAGDMAHFFIYYLGDDIGDAIVTCFGITVILAIFIMIWRAATNFKVPILQRFTHSGIETEE